MPYIVTYNDTASRIRYLQQQPNEFSYRIHDKAHATRFARHRDARCWLERLVHKHSWFDIRHQFTVIKDEP